MNYIEDALTEWFGERCPEFHPDCHVCKAWAEYDGIEWMSGRISELEAKVLNIEGQRGEVIYHATRMAKAIYDMTEN